MRIPKHIGIIPDGNRRWAQQRGMEKQDGYTFGLDPGVEALRLAQQYGVEEVTYYGFTTDNCRRPRPQVHAFQKACLDAVERIGRCGGELLVVGNDRSPDFPQPLGRYRTRTRVGDGNIKVNFLVNYGWEWDVEPLMQPHGRRQIVQGLRSHDVSRIDLVIRWGGMRRLSGFLPVQSVYADFYVVDELWPDFSPDQFHAAIDWYSRQDVTRGG
ncbi:undecaprenyl diphosphate synthase family protein [Intestinibacillus massiliensis]|uniref:undecaprenyl diphosphate synthase family protein n=1 Tax=Intestinibacillus massiliensis TaxID=1871029 RepID=UPI000B355344|nr:undecaprenyl diphosphate synthase family protein [Intestinibacillus massiliensis]MCB6365512.1 undecaprenyl diphosphate synthase family protein [Intestinibacillus massiliensis]